MTHAALAAPLLNHRQQAAEAKQACTLLQEQLSDAQAASQELQRGRDGAIERLAVCTGQLETQRAASEAAEERNGAWVGAPWAER